MEPAIRSATAQLLRQTWSHTVSDGPQVMAQHREVSQDSLRRPDEN